MGTKKTNKFYKDFYEENRISVLQYASLRTNFYNMVSDVLGKDYYNMAMDVYEGDRICCEDVAYKAKRTAWQRFMEATKK
jgi:hypothetical protein